MKVECVQNQKDLDDIVITDNLPPSEKVVTFTFGQVNAARPQVYTADHGDRPGPIASGSSTGLLVSAENTLREVTTRIPTSP